MTDAADERTAAKEVPGRIKWSARLAFVLIRMLGATWRVRQHNDAPWRALRARKAPYVLALWHHDVLSMIWAHRNQQIAVLVSEHGDGEIIARVIEWLGNNTVRGSSTRGGTRALIGIIRALERGASAAITPDGPRGPRHIWQPGVLTAARRANAPIVCVGIAVSRAWRFNSWDRFVLPKPFARITIAYADPAGVQTTSDDFAAEADRFSALMAQVAQTADEVSARA